MRRWATGPYEIGWYGNGLWQRRVDALAQRDREAAWQVRLDALDQLHARFTRLSTMNGSNDLGPHDRRCRPLYALTIRLSDAADQQKLAKIKMDFSDLFGVGGAGRQVSSRFYFFIQLYPFSFFFF
jgi:hypothetical protein